MSQYTHGGKLDLTAKQAPVGIGCQSAFRCMGCALTKPNLGSKGVGIKKRCAECLENGKA